MSQAIPVTVRGPATYDKLKVLRLTYALTVLGVIIISWCLSGTAVISQVNSAFTEYDRTVWNTGATDGEDISERDSLFSPLLLITLCALPAFGCVLLAAIYSNKVGMPSAIAPLLLAPWPFLRWIAFFMIVGYTPHHLKEFEPPESPMPLAVWLIVACAPLSLPVLVMALLMFVNPQYIAQLFYGPPVGAYVPGLPLPCGWPILMMIFLAVLMSNVYLWFGFRKGLVRKWWRLLLGILVLFLFTLPAVWLVVMGPAAVQVYKQFFGS